MSRTGGAVTIFINGNPADDTDFYDILSQTPSAIILPDRLECHIGVAD